MNQNKIRKFQSANRNQSVSPARTAALQILMKIDMEKAFSSVLLPLFEEKLELKDRALCHEITLGVLRKQFYLDEIIEKLTNGKKIDSAVKIILRFALYQLLFLDKIPAHAAINDAVNLTQKAKKTSAKGFVNAVLRRFIREKIELKFADEIEKISVETSNPRWLIEKWISQFGIEETAKLAEANNKTPQMNYRFTAKSLEKTRRSVGAITRSEMFELADKGEIYFQDEGSQMVAESVDLKEKESFLDVCAAPGSKTTYVASQKEKVKSQNFIVAGDLHWSRVKILRENCRRQGVDFVQILQYDAEKFLPFADESFDVVLLDAPCSGTGTIRHNPEIRYFLREKDFAELQAKQLKILANASKTVKSGGRLVYSTCSLEREENEDVCRRFLAENEAFFQIDVKIAEKFKTAEKFARTFPQRDETDGFFIAAFAKK